MNIACCVEYDGTDFHGFQRQSGNHGPTVQGALETAIAQVSGGVFSVVNGAGRTDAGVHASGQVITFTTSLQRSPEIWLRSLNAVLPKSVAIRWVRNVPEQFHARFSAVSRSYRYTVWNDPAPTALRARYSYHCHHELDVALMSEACQELVGNKDFGAFGHSPNKSLSLQTEPGHCVRTMLEARCIRPEANELIYYDFTANAFLTGQVRRMVGTLLLVGQRRLSLEEFREIVQRAEKTHPGSAAPSHGLCLVRVEYPENFGVNDGKDI
ncbi:tRNA pseudouridine(38-40) synthase TruA [Dictyobacter arantiisoli]|uniref:tRNA pseudouridine synthase A n=1 Tax=Dictyobacter arantiisoli TaxID=2014874 RepID=A0A5A5TD50_9CHLR|nr:tRNA pseudouridine(38-40) synthase TruA [Dictyobacter arantiisoli]GCF08963.1 tRNA pseudouridine synthase A [Dictyobacter arantiisoli]